MECHWDEGTHVLDRECRSRNPALTLVHLPLRREHAHADHAGNEGARLPRLLVDCRVFKNVREGDRVKSDETFFPLKKA